MTKNQDTKELVELRSDSTRKFIEEEPPLFIRYGTTVIVFFLLAFAGLGYLMKVAL